MCKTYKKSYKNVYKTDKTYIKPIKNYSFAMLCYVLLCFPMLQTTEEMANGVSAVSRMNFRQFRGWIRHSCLRIQSEHVHKNIGSRTWGRLNGCIGLYGQIPKQPKPGKTKQKQAKNKQNQAKAKTNSQKKRAP